MNTTIMQSIGAIGLVLLVGLLFLAVLFLTQWLWNTTVSDIFKIRRITLWETFKILLLSSILFGGATLPFHHSTTVTDGNTTTTYGLGIFKK
jgi:hypothetical protein